jgi:hypothetical protein
MKQPPKKSAQIRRRERRYTVPVFSVRINAELETPQRTYHGLLWDISTQGACIQAFEPIPVGLVCRLRLHQHAGPEVIEREVRLIWTDCVMRAYYVGMCFDEPILADSSTFLGVLIENARQSQENSNSNTD